MSCEGTGGRVQRRLRSDTFIFTLTGKNRGVRFSWLIRMKADPGLEEGRITNQTGGWTGGELLDSQCCCWLDNGHAPMPTHQSMTPVGPSLTHTVHDSRYAAIPMEVQFQQVLLTPLPSVTSRRYQPQDISPLKSEISPHISEISPQISAPWSAEAPVWLQEQGIRLLQAQTSGGSHHLPSPLLLPSTLEM